MARPWLQALWWCLCLLTWLAGSAAPAGTERSLPFTEDSLFTQPGRSAVPRSTAALAGTAAAAAQDESPQELITKEDLLVVIPTSLSRMALVDASRRWRRGVRTYLVADKVLPFQLREKFRIHRETWGTFEDNKASDLDVGARQGDLRAAMAPFMANITFPGKYKWILYGDDDTVMFIDNILHTLNSGHLDWRKPYLVSDSLWWPEGGSGTKLHPNREAPRCLPCGFTDPLLNGGGCPGHKGFLAPLGCPCSPALVLQGKWAEGEPVFPDDRGIFNRSAPDFVHRPGYFHSPYIGWWYMIHGGAGALISRTALERNTFEAVHGYIRALPVQSGDAMLSRAFWFMLALAPTDPGYGFCRKHIQMFDPGFAGYRARGKEDAGAADGGADPLGVLKRLEWALAGSGCDAQCHDQLQHTISVHVRGRHVANEWWQDTPKELAEDSNGHEIYQVACHVIERLALLGEQYSAWLNTTNSRERFLPRWSEDTPQTLAASQ